MKEKLSTATVAVQGSGWGWLGYNKAAAKLQIATCFNQVSSQKLFYSNILKILSLTNKVSEWSERMNVAKGINLHIEKTSPMDAKCASVWK